VEHHQAVALVETVLHQRFQELQLITAAAVAPELTQMWAAQVDLAVAELEALTQVMVEMEL
jgi:hypothetical protein